MSGFGSQTIDRTPVPGRDRRHPRVGAQGLDQRRPLAVERRRRPPQQDRERRRVAEVLVLQLLPPRRLGARDGDRGGPQLALDPEPGDAERGDDDERHREGSARMAQRERRPFHRAARFRRIPRPPTRATLRAETAVRARPSGWSVELPSERIVVPRGLGGVLRRWGLFPCYGTGKVHCGGESGARGISRREVEQLTKRKMLGS